jgi:hypothetical protein
MEHYYNCFEMNINDWIQYILPPTLTGLDSYSVPQDGNTRCNELPETVMHQKDFTLQVPTLTDETKYVVVAFLATA